jgi:alpha-galactosidase
VDVPAEQVRFRCGGINHMNWVLAFSRDGEDLYPRLRRAMEDPAIYSRDKVRFEILRRFGCFVTESSEHMAEYVPYFIPHESLIEKLDIPIREYVHRCEQILDVYAKHKALASSDEPLELHRSAEYCSQIIHSIATGQPRVIYGNVQNRGLIPNLPDGCCVEVPCLVDRNGMQPCHVGELPPQLAALNRANVSVQELAVRAALEKRRDHAYHACLLDPNAAAVLTMDQIVAMVDDLIAAHGPDLAYLA